MVIVKKIIFTCVIYAVNVFETDCNQSLAIRMDHSLVYEN